MATIIGFSLSLMLTATGVTADFDGEWESTFGKLTLQQVDGSVTGTYPLGTIDGTIEGRRLTFAYVEDAAEGEGWFELGTDGLSFRGKWRSNGTETWSDWGGGKIVRDYTGLWDTSFGRMRLTQVGDRVTGRYSLAGGAAVEGRIVDGKLRFRYTEPQVHGEGEFVISAGADAFEGRWRPLGSTSSTNDAPVHGRWGEWTGQRVVPEERVVWLVILEAHWEGSLAEREYAFGDMLRSYFTMATARHVKVRHRYFHDLADFQRFSREVAFLAEPVVLLISTHGTPAGIQVAGRTLDAEAIASGVAGAGNIELLHLSGCSMMKGDVPTSILERLPEGERFPISGYSTLVAWDASALADFTFLSMLLIRRLDPEHAVRQTHLVAPFTGSDPVEGSQFRSLGLEVLMPSAIRSKSSAGATPVAPGTPRR